MSAVTTTFSPAQRDAAARRLTTRATRKALSWTTGAFAVWGGGALAALAVIAAAVPLVLSARGNTMTDGGVLFALPYVLRWVVFSIGIGAIWMLLPVHLGAGGTRRTLHRGLTLGTALAALAMGLLFGVARLGEQALFGALDFGWSEPSALARAAGGAAAAFTVASLSEALVLIVYGLVGATCFSTFRPGKVRDLVVLRGFASFLLVPLVEAVTLSGIWGDWLGDGLADMLGIEDLPVVGLVLAAVLAAAAVAWSWLHLRSLELGPPSR